MSIARPRLFVKSFDPYDRFVISEVSVMRF